MINFSSTDRQNVIALKENEIHLWIVNPQHCVTENIKLNNALFNQYRNLLTEEETAKQQRYKFEKDREDALITRAFVRDLLSHYADISPQAWRFEKGEKDKPKIVNSTIPLRFNLSHTKDMIVCAVTLNNDIGCDVENITRSNDVLKVAERYFSPFEIDALFSLPKEEQRNRFFDYWTLKEAYIKAWGLGLAIPLKDFSFDIFEQEKTKEIGGNTLPFDCNQSIDITFASHRKDEPSLWQHWLFYPNNEHRLALSLRDKSKSRDENSVAIKFIESIPMLKTEEKTTAN